MSTALRCIARALASVFMIRAGLFPVGISRDDRTKYIETLEKADAGDLSVLCHLFSESQKRALTKAIGLVVDMKPVAPRRKRSQQRETFSPAQDALDLNDT